MEWISVKDRFPEKFEWVFVKACKRKWVDGPIIFVAQLGGYYEEGEWNCAYGDGYIPQEVEIRYWAALSEIE